MKDKIIKIRNKEMAITAVSDPSYETDYSKWAKSQSRFLKNREFDKLDIDHLIEEIQELGVSNKSALESHLTIALIHMLKQKYDFRHICTSWQNSIDNALVQIDKIIEKNPSLRRYLNTEFSNCYTKARKYASKQTGLFESAFPEECPWTIKKVLGE